MLTKFEENCTKSAIARVQTHTYVGTYIYTYIHRTSYSIYMIWQMDDQLPLNVLLQLMIYVIDLLQGTVFEVNSYKCVVKMHLLERHLSL